MSGRMVGTVEELEELRTGSIVLTRRGSHFTRTALGFTINGGGVVVSRSCLFMSGLGPFEVLWEPLF